MYGWTFKFNGHNCLSCVSLMCFISNLLDDKSIPFSSSKLGLHGKEK